MDNKKLFLVKKSFFRNKKNFIRIIICSLLILFTILGCNVYSTLNMYVKKSLKENINSRTLILYNNNYTTYQQIVDSTKEIKEINKIFDYSKHQVMVKLNKIENKKYDGFITLIANLNQFPQIKNENEIICGERFIPKDNIEFTNVSKKDIIKVNNKTLIINYASNVDFKIFELKLKNIDLFENNFYNYDNNFCYADSSLINKIYQDMEIDSEPLYVALLNKYEDIEVATNKLESLGYSADPIYKIDKGIVESITLIASIILITLLIFSIVSLLFFRKKLKTDINKTCQLLYYLGFDEIYINKFIVFNELLLFFCSLILSLILLFIFIITYNFIIYFNPFAFYRFRLSIDFVILFICLTIISIIYIKSCFKKRTI